MHVSLPAVPAAKRGEGLPEAVPDVPLHAAGRDRDPRIIEVPLDLADLVGVREIVAARRTRARARHQVAAAAGTAVRQPEEVAELVGRDPGRVVAVVDGLAAHPDPAVAERPY